MLLTCFVIYVWVCTVLRRIFDHCESSEGVITEICVNSPGWIKVKFRGSLISTRMIPLKPNVDMNRFNARGSRFDFSILTKEVHFGGRKKHFSLNHLSRYVSILNIVNLSIMESDRIIHRLNFANSGIIHPIESILNPYRLYGIAQLEDL